MLGQLGTLLLILNCTTPMLDVVDRTNAEKTLDYAIALLKAGKYQEYYDELILPGSKRYIERSGEPSYVEALKKWGPDMLLGFEAARKSKPIERMSFDQKQTLYKIAHPNKVFPRPKEIYFEEVFLHFEDGRWYFED